ncbi:MAG: methionine--tRNA ligase [Bacteroidia bacterium]|nr:methionine--tRNA ligase [Bacteroidia bacterium]
MSTSAKTFKRFTVTSALPYANGPLHLGHLAGAYIPADIYVRYLRARGRDVLFVCGTDEHGAAINIRARKDNLTPQEVVDKYYEIISAGFKGMNINFDVFSRTSKKIHHETASEFFLKFYNEGKFIEKSIEQLYDPEAQMFLADRFVTGTCPKCGHPSAYGDQCEKCGSSLSPTDLIDPKSTITGATPTLRETKHWYLPLDQYQERLEKFILEDHTYWKRNVFGQCKSWLKEGLQPRAITRDLDWGVKVPVEGAEGKVLYVWFDAPIGYISATREWAEEHNQDWKKWWQDDDTALIHFIGKDNIVFHCLIFPAILMGHGDYILPENVPANEFLNLEGEKLSTSRNWAIWAHEFIEEFPDKVDVMRYVLTANMPEQKDSDFTWKDFQGRNKDLADVLGNFIRRAGVLTHKYYEGKLPEAKLTADQEQILGEARELLGEVAQNIENFRFRDALKAAMDIATKGNKYLADSEPWQVIKTDPEAVKGIMVTCIQLAALLPFAFGPFMPETAEKISQSLGLVGGSWDTALQSSLLVSGHVIGPVGEVLFNKIEDSVIEAQVEKLKANAAGGAPEAVKVAEFKPETTFDKFQEMDLRAVTITAAEQHPNADRLLKLTVDTGRDVRTVVSGVAEFFKPADLIGKQALLLANLAPRKIRGIESQGMLLFAEDSEGKLTLVSPANPVNNGSTVA